MKKTRGIMQGGNSRTPGLRHHRIAENREIYERDGKQHDLVLLEEHFFEEWVGESEDRGTPLLSEIRPLTRRDRIVAATIVQWLGTHIGKAFLDRALKRGGFVTIRESQLNKIKDSLEESRDAADLGKMVMKIIAKNLQETEAETKPTQTTCEKSS